MARIWESPGKKSPHFPYTHPQQPVGTLLMPRANRASRPSIGSNRHIPRPAHTFPAFRHASLGEGPTCTRSHSGTV